jgi:hypothetical protein
MKIIHNLSKLIVVITLISFISTEERYSHPILINERSLIQDCSDLIRLQKRMDVATNLLDTTYDSVGEILLLDVNMHFEEHIQTGIEHSDFFTKSAKIISTVIQKSGIIESIKTLDVDDRKTTLRTQRINWIAEFLWEKYERELKENSSFESLQDLKEKFNDEAYFKAPENYLSKIANVVQGKAKEYLSLVKMLWSQYPYFGGSVEYKEGKQDLEFWIYHISTLTRDPDRNFLFASYSTNGQKMLPKKMMDYLTYKDMFVPSYNQRNLGIAIDNINWEHTPPSLRKLIILALDELGKQKIKIDKVLILSDTQKDYKNRLDILEQFHFIPRERNEEKEIENLWNEILKINKLGVFYDDVVKIDWFRSQNRNPSNLNIVGMRKNVLITPEEAGKLLEKDLEKAFGGFTRVPSDTFVGVSETELPFSHYGNELRQKHTEWFIKTKEFNKPILGGISGHTLGYINIYKAALEKIIATQSDPHSPESLKEISVKDLPSLEIMRAIMMGGLIGNKRHHSYDEVMTASHNIPIPHPTIERESKMSYKYPFNYADLFDSSIQQIRNVAETAWNETMNNIIQPNRHSVLKLLYNMILDGKESEKLVLQSYLVEYLNLTRLKDKKSEMQQVKNKIIENVESLIKAYRVRMMGENGFLKYLS